MNANMPGRLFDTSKNFSRTSYINDTKFAEMSNSLDINKTIFKFKVILLGNISVGKTCLLSRFMDNKFTEDHKSSIGVEFKMKTLPIDKSTIADLKIWDTCGDERYRTITRQYYREAKGAILIFDLTNRKSFEQLDSWLDDINEYAPEKINILLVGNKSDLTNLRQISSAEASGYAQRNHLPYLDVSAKNGSNVSLVFDRLANILVKHERDKVIDEKLSKKTHVKAFKTTQLNFKSEKTSKCCSFG